MLKRASKGKNRFKKKRILVQAYKWRIIFVQFLYLLFAADGFTFSTNERMKKKNYFQTFWGCYFCKKEKKMILFCVHTCTKAHSIRSYTHTHTHWLNFIHFDFERNRIKERKKSNWKILVYFKNNNSVYFICSYLRFGTAVAACIGGGTLYGNGNLAATAGFSNNMFSNFLYFI